MPVADFLSFLASCCPGFALVFETFPVFFISLSLSANLSLSPLTNFLLAMAVTKKNLYFSRAVASAASLCMLLSFVVTEAAPTSALITQLPGFNSNFPSKHYSGYVKIGKKSEKNLFYYLVTSERNPLNDPVVLWLNGGPGCSSFDGFVYEHGPFNFEAGKSPGDMPTLHLNPYSWSKVSNVIYLDSPVGVGFSYSTNRSAYITGDLQTASDTHSFLLKWLQLFPEFIANPFYVAGESYSGIYVPTLSSEIAKGIKSGVKPIINFKGYMIGNGVTDPKFDGNALVPFAYGMALISNDMFKEVEAACNGTYYHPQTESCYTSMDKIDTVLNDLNIYDILEPCYHSKSNNNGNGNGNTSVPDSFKQLGATEKSLAVRKRMFGRAWPFRAPVRDGLVPLWSHELTSKAGFVPCFNDEVATLWLNNEAVRKAIHAEPASVAGEWDLCTNKILYSHDAGSMIDYHKNLTSGSYRALIFSGDHDMCVPYTGSAAWTRSIGYKIVDGWRPWFSKDQVAGYTQGYDNNLTFLTVKGAGHTVPEYKPQEALDFYSRWLEGKKI